MEQVMANQGTKTAHMIRIGKRIRAWYVAKGFISTNFGLVHTEWIEEGIRQQWIAPAGSRYPNIFNLVVNVWEDKKNIRKGRQFEEIPEDKYDLSPGKAWFDFLQKKREAFAEIHKETLHRMRIALFDTTPTI